jgi:hypothetical protein
MPNERKFASTRTLLLSAAFVLSGCDSFYGVVRTTKPKASVAHQCIELALSQTAGVKNVQYRLVGDDPLYQRHFYDYEYDEVKIRLTVLQNSSGTTLTHLYLKNRGIPPHIERARQLMDRVERSVASSCVDPGSWGEAKEECRGVKCAPLL